MQNLRDKIRRMDIKTLRRNRNAMRSWNFFISGSRREVIKGQSWELQCPTGSINKNQNCTETAYSWRGWDIYINHLSPSLFSKSSGPYREVRARPGRVRVSDDFARLAWTVWKSRQVAAAGEASPISGTAGAHMAACSRCCDVVHRWHIEWCLRGRGCLFKIQVHVTAIEGVTNIIIRCRTGFRRSWLWNMIRKVTRKEYENLHCNRRSLDVPRYVFQDLGLPSLVPGILR